MKKTNYKTVKKPISKLRKYLYERLNIVIILATVIVVTTIFLSIHFYTEFNIINFIATNILCQTIIMILTISSFINIFYPFTIRRELKEKDIEKKIIDKKIEDEKNERIKEQATIR
jgi:hypothetical protein